MSPICRSFEKFIKKFHEEICGNSQAIVNFDYDYYIDKKANAMTLTMERPSVGTEFNDGKDLYDWLNFCISLQIFPNISLIKDGELNIKIEENELPWKNYNGRFFCKETENCKFSQHTECILELYPFFSGF